MCNHHEIQIWNLQNDGNSYLFHMHASDFKKLIKIVRKTHMKVRIVKKRGLPFFLFRYRKRTLFFSGILLGLLLLFFLSIHIWNIQITGNQSDTDETILSYLRTQGIYDGMWKKDVHCAEIATALREDFDNLTWVSVSLDGTCLTIKVKESSDTSAMSDHSKQETMPDVETASDTETASDVEPATDEKDGTVGTDLVATEDGQIISIITRTGTPLVHAGDSVQKGDILVTGRIEIVNDSDEITGYHYVDADADIWLQSTKTYKESLNLKSKIKSYTGKEQKSYYFNIFGYSFGIGAKASSFKHCESSTQEYQVQLWKSFYLPVYYGKSIMREYKYDSVTYTKEEAEKQLYDDFHKFCRNLAEKGVEITENSVKILVGKNELRLAGTLTVRSLVSGRAQTEILSLPDLKEVQEET